jgi:hypothetical protein
MVQARYMRRAVRQWLLLLSLRRLQRARATAAWRLPARKARQRSEYDARLSITSQQRSGAPPQRCWRGSTRGEEEYAQAASRSRQRAVLQQCSFAGRARYKRPHACPVRSGGTAKSQARIRRQRAVYSRYSAPHHPSRHQSSFRMQAAEPRHVPECRIKSAWWHYVRCPKYHPTEDNGIKNATEEEARKGSMVNGM